MNQWTTIRIRKNTLEFANKMNYQLKIKGINTNKDQIILLALKRLKGEKNWKKEMNKLK